jgi:HD-GYP domain-containing protein (c-di-GMP phosphodiesterase class II)
MQQHPRFGAASLQKAKDVDPEMIDVVLHHHEYLDGSGYPDGLTDESISDLVRMLTISDIFGALIERRSYKAPLPTDAAYDVLMKMGPKLDRDLVREFGKMIRSLE